MDLRVRLGPLREQLHVAPRHCDHAGRVALAVLDAPVLAAIASAAALAFPARLRARGSWTRFSWCNSDFGTRQRETQGTPHLRPPVGRPWAKDVTTYSFCPVQTNTVNKAPFCIDISHILATLKKKDGTSPSANNAQSLVVVRGMAVDRQTAHERLVSALRARLDDTRASWPHAKDVCAAIAKLRAALPRVRVSASARGDAIAHIEALEAWIALIAPSYCRSLEGLWLPLAEDYLDDDEISRILPQRRTTAIDRQRWPRCAPAGAPWPHGSRQRRARVLRERSAGVAA